MSKVLIIEDESPLLQNLASFLTSFGDEFEVRTAPSGEEGMAALEADPDVDILLTDVRLPGIDGIEVVRRTVKEWPDIRIVVMTAFGSPDLRTMAEGEGALRFIDKPVDLDALPDILREVSESRQRRSHAVGGLNILEVAQFVAMARETKVIRFKTEQEEGTLVFENGVVAHCSAKRLAGVDAFLEMVVWGEGTFWEIFDVATRTYAKNVDIPTGELLDQATRLSEEVEAGSSRDTSLDEKEAPGPVPTDAAPATPRGAGRKPTKAKKQAAASRSRKTRTKKGKTVHQVDQRESNSAGTAGKENVMALESYLDEFKEINGYLASGIMDFTGEVLAMHATSDKTPLEAAGASFNDIFRSAHAASEKLGLEACRSLVVTTPKGLIVMACSGVESAAHFHLIAVLGEGGNQALARVTMDKVIPQIMKELG